MSYKNLKIVGNQDIKALLPTILERDIEYKARPRFN